MAFEANLQQKP